MILFKKAGHLIQYITRLKEESKTIGFVPTMGALHTGHLSLIESSKKNNDITVCSIFVNPTQFNDVKDFEKYPVTLETDIAILEQSGTDILFLPSIAEVYPQGVDHLMHYDLGYLDQILEGKFRPGHFQGVCQVMDRLLNIVKPDHFYLGLKDYQQCLVVKRLIEITESNSRLVTSPTLREADGLAMSSRNQRLDKESRNTAPAIFQTLLYLKTNLKKGPLVSMKEEAGHMLLNHGFRIDYIEIADLDNLDILDNWNGSNKLIALIAVFIKGVRLIDNMIITDN